MKFHSAILSPVGDVSGNNARDSDDLALNPVNRKMMAEFKDLLRENLTDNPLKTGNFWASFGDPRHMFQWQQVMPLAAMGKFYVRGQIVAASFYLFGLVMDLDEAVLEATDVLFEDWFGGRRKARGACRGLRSIKQRPVLIILPAAKSVLKPDDWRIISNLCPCFASAFFERAESSIKAIETYWYNRGFRKGGTAEDFLRN